jgi:uncharacterized protein (TIGR02246 family)
MIVKTWACVLLVFCAAVASSGCDRATATPGADATLNAHDFGEEFEAAYNAKDPARIAALYSEDAELMPPDSTTVKGRAAIAALFKEKFEQNCVMDVSSTRSEASGERAFDTGRMIVTMTDPEAGTQVVSGNYLTVYKRVGNDWKIAYHMQTIDPSR